MSKDVVSNFDPFGEEDDDFATPQTNSSDPWTPRAWGSDANSGLDITFDSTTLFDFSAESADRNESREFLFPEDPMNTSGKKPTVQIVIKEQLACLYDEFSNTSSGRVDGSIYIRAGNKRTPNPFCLVVRDANGHLDSLQEHSKVCHDITFNVNRKKGKSVRTGDRVFRVTLSPSVSQSTPVAKYVCDSSLRPIPMLVKTNVFVSKGYCNVMIKIRANPSNNVPLTNLAILLAVPPDLNGETVKILERAGIWDGMKRVIAWSIEQLDPGGVIPLQCQFEFVVKPSDEESKRPTPKFPILVRCEAMDEQLSGIELNTDYNDDLSSPVIMNLSCSVSILHRKV